MKILMLNPPFLPMFSRFSRSPAVTKSGTIYYPIWHAYAAGVLEENGHDVKIIDACADGLTRDDCYEMVRNFHPQIVVVYTSTPSIYNDVEVSAGIKRILPDIFLVLTGPHVTALPEDSLGLNNGVDIIARGEYDATLLELAQVLPDREKLGEVKGITFREKENIFSTPDRDFITDLDDLPFVSKVYKKHLQINNYFYAHCRFPVVSIFTSRGCGARCSFCVYPQQMFGRKQRQRSPENIVKEFEYIIKELPYVKEILIDDDTFSFNQNHTREFCSLIVKKKIKIPWTVECRANLNYETMVLMKKAGCRLIVVGFESADEHILKNIDKGISVKNMRNFVRDVKRAGIMLHSCFMAGNPGETKNTLNKSLKFAMSINADTCQFFPLMVYPGTEAYDWAKTNNYIKAKDFRDWLTPDGLHNCVVNTPQLSAHDLVTFCDYARKKYYLNLWYILNKLQTIVKRPGELRKTIKAFLVFFKYLFSRTSK